MNKVILFVLMTTLFVTACTNNAQNVSESSTDNSPEKKVDTKQEQIENANIILEIDRTEYLTGEIITDGDYEISSNGIGTICFVPDKESRKIIEEKYSIYDLYYLNDESYYLYYDNVTITENLPNEVGVYKVKVKFDINSINNYNRFKLIDIELTDNIGTILYEGKSYETNNLDLDVKVKDRVCGLIVSSVDRLGEEGLRVGFCGEIETGGYYNIYYSEMYDSNYGCIYYDEKYKDNIPMIMGENNNKELFYFVNKENMFKELVNYSSFGRGKFKTSNYDLVYNFGIGRAPSDVLTEIVSLDENYKNMFEIKDISTTNIMGYTDDFAIVSNATKYDENNYAELYDYYYINKNNPEKVYLFATNNYYKLKEVINEKEFKLITVNTPIDAPDELICKITDKGVDISYPTNNPGEMETNSIINKFNISAINDNGNQIATDGKFIYYIDIKTRYINRVQIDGLNNETISEHKCSKLFYYKGKLYFLEYTQLNSWIACIDMDGSNYEIIYEQKMVNDFIIHNDAIYMTAFVEEQEAGYAYGFYKYNLSNGVIETFDDSIAIPLSLGLCLINDKLYYSINYKTREYDINTNTVKEYDISIRDMQEYNNYIYSYSNTYISRHEIDNISKFDKIYEIDDDYIIKRISVIDDLIFFTYAYDYTKRDEKVIFVDVVNIDGSNRRNIFQFEYSTLGHYGFEKIYVLNDKLLVISTDSQYPLFKVFDYEGNELWGLY